MATGTIDAALAPQAAQPIGKSSMNAAQVVTPPAAELVLTIITVMMYMVSLSYGGLVATICNYVGPALLGVAVLWAVFVFVRRDINTIWTPLVWIRLAIAAYFGIGAIVPFLTNDQTSDLIRAFFNFYEIDVIKYNLVNSVFVLLFSLFSTITLGTLRSTNFRRYFNIAEPKFTTSAIRQEVFGGILIFIGLTTNILIVYPIQFGWISGNIPQAASSLSQLSLVGYFLCINWAVRTKSNFQYLVLALCAFESFMGAAQLSKFATIFPWVMAAMGFFYTQITWKRMAAFGFGIGLLYFAVAPVLAFSREYIANQYGTEYSAPFGERLNAMQSYYSGAGKISDDDVQLGWARLSYVNAGSWAISQYDHGLPGDSWRYMFIVWIPRVIYPGKPIITDVSREFTFMVNGNFDSSTSPGLPAEGYWVLGWIGVAICAMILNLIFVFWSLYSIAVLRSRAWHLFFIVLMGMRTGLRIDGSMVADVIGPIGIAVIAHIVLELANRHFPTRISTVLNSVGAS